MLLGNTHTHTHMRVAESTEPKMQILLSKKHTHTHVCVCVCCRTQETVAQRTVYNRNLKFAGCRKHKRRWDNTHVCCRKSRSFTLRCWKKKCCGKNTHACCRKQRTLAQPSIFAQKADVTPPKIQMLLGKLACVCVCVAEGKEPSLSLACPYRSLMLRRRKKKCWESHTHTHVCCGTQGTLTQSCIFTQKLVVENQMLCPSLMSRDSVLPAISKCPEILSVVIDNEEDLCAGQRSCGDQEPGHAAHAT